MINLTIWLTFTWWAVHIAVFVLVRKIGLMDNCSALLLLRLFLTVIAPLSLMLIASGVVFGLWIRDLVFQ